MINRNQITYYPSFRFHLRGHVNPMLYRNDRRPDNINKIINEQTIKWAEITNKIKQINNE